MKELTSYFRNFRVLKSLSAGRKRISFSRLLALALTPVLLTSLDSLRADPRRDSRGDDTVNYWSRYGKTELILDHTRFDPGEEIALQFRVTNDGHRVIRIYPDATPGKTFQFMVTDLKGRELPLHIKREAIQRREAGVKPVVDLQGAEVKEIILNPGESFEKRLYLNDYYDLKPGTDYRITGYYYPDARFSFFVRSENTVQIRLDRHRETAYLSLHEADPRSSEARAGVSPEETVYLFLSAEIRENWKNYLKYLDLEKYITVYDRFSSRFATASQDERPVILNQFKEYLTRHPTDHLRQFRIVRSEPERGPDGEILENGRAFVTARALRESNGYSVRYEYTYTLERAGDEQAEFWKITHVIARVVE